jgi:proline iminopeptidase
MRTKMSVNPTFSFNMHTETLLVDSESAKLFTIVYPKQNAETVLLLHGGPGVPMDFSPIAEQLSRKYQVIAFDQRGTGRSPAQDATYTIDEYLKDIDAIMVHFGINKFHLFGHSWGGLYAQLYAERNPQNILSMFLSSPSSGTGRLWKQTESEVMSFNKEYSGFWGWSMMGVKSLLGMLGLDTAYQSMFKQVLENYNKVFDPTFTATDEMVKNVRAEPVNKTRPRILEYPPLKDSRDYHFPIMITYGQKDIYGASKEKVRDRFPQAMFMEIENAGHIAWRHNPRKFNNILFEFYRIQADKN